MKLIIPMSGLGERFKAAGYITPKPMIEIFKKPMVAHVLDCFPGMDEVVFVINEDHEKEFRISDRLKAYAPDAKYLTIPEYKLGPVKAILRAQNTYGFVDEKDDVIVNYCDFWQEWDFEAFKSFVRETRPSGVVACWTGFHPHMLNNTKFAYVRAEGDVVKEIREKESFTDDPMNEFASTGTYYFGSGELMLDTMNEQVSRGLHVNGEYYASLPFQVMLERGLDVRSFLVNKFVSWGNPVDYEEFTYAVSSYTRNYDPGKADNVLLPIGGIGKRFVDAGYDTPKPLIEVSGKPMFKTALHYLPKGRTVIATVRGPGDAVVEAAPLGRHVVLDEPTDGQARTCYLALKEADITEGTLVIGACDHANLLDFEPPDADFGVFATRGYPGGKKKPSSYGWVDADAAGIVKRIVVKEKLYDPSTDWLLTGAFWFREPRVFLEAAERMFAVDDRVNGEFYVDKALDHAIKLGYFGKVVPVDYFVPWGTPDELKTNLFWDDLFSKWEPWSASPLSPIRPRTCS